MSLLLARPRVRVQDGFNRADSALALGGALTGQLWRADVGTWGITAGRAYGVTALAGDRATMESGLVDALTDCLVSETNYAIGAPSLIFRGIDANNQLNVYLFNGTTGLQKWDAGVITTLATAVTPTVNGQAYTLRVIARGASLAIFVDSVLLISYTLAGADAAKFTGSTATRVGLNLGGASANTRFDNLVVQSL